jgi:hypothetical protein
MKKLAFGALLTGLLAACGGSDSNTTPDGPRPIDAAPGDGGSPIDAAPAACNVLTQDGCDPGEKCTWIRVAASPSSQLGQLGCVPDGSVAINQACSYGAAGPTTGYDNCVEGLVCLASSQTDMAQGLCREICDLTNTEAAAACPSFYSCGAYSKLFSNASSETPSGGICDPTCNPLTNELDDTSLSSTDRANCGEGLEDDGAGGMRPTHGCYGLASSNANPTDYSCARSQWGGGHRTELAEPIYLNSCDPGYVPALAESTANLETAICVAICDPHDTSLSDTTSPGGDSPHTCADKGAIAATEECIYQWWFEDATTPISLGSDAYGLCLDYTKYNYDDDNNAGTANVTFPACATLGFTGDPNTAPDEAWMWGCTSTASIPTAFAPGRPAARDMGVNIRLVNPTVSAQ